MVCEREGQAWWTESGGLMVFEGEGQACSLGQVVSWFVRGKVRPSGLGQVLVDWVRCSHVCDLFARSGGGCYVFGTANLHQSCIVGDIFICYKTIDYIVPVL